jgi:hypothetical protein
LPKRGTVEGAFVKGGETVGRLRQLSPLRKRGCKGDLDNEKTFTVRHEAKPASGERRRRFLSPERDPYASPISARNLFHFNDKR